MSYLRKIMVLVFLILAAKAYALAEKDTKVNDLDDDIKGKITGKIQEKSSETPLEFANVAIYNQKDSSLVTGGITDENGVFEINNLTFGDYYLVANFIGFNETNIADITIDRGSRIYHTGAINLAASTVALGEVNVVADKAAVEYKLDKKVVNVSQVISAIGGTAVDVLENTPSVQVDIEGNVSLRGSGNFTVLIDGRPSVLSGSDALRQIPSSAIENIEIITNPSAKYEIGSKKQV